MKMTLKKFLESPYKYIQQVPIILTVGNRPKYQITLYTKPVGVKESPKPRHWLKRLLD